MTLEVAENYISFGEPDTEKAVKSRIVNTLRVDTASEQITNVRG